jgi:hypothetical protein
MALEKLSATCSPARRLRGDYIPREKAEADLRKYLAIASNSGYLVVTAPIGSGKTTVIHHVLAEGGRTGVLLVNVKTKDAHPDIETLVVQALGIPSGDPLGGDRMSFIMEVSARYRKEHGGIQPVYVLKSRAIAPTLRSSDHSPSSSTTL